MEKKKLQIKIGNTGYVIEKIHCSKDKEDIDMCPLKDVDDDFTYDARTGNIHVFPMRKDIAQEIANDIDSKLKKIKCKLEQMCKSKEKCKLKGICKLDDNEYRIRINRPRMFKDTDYEKAKDIYSYLSFKIPKYDLDFQIVGVKFIKVRKNIIDVYMREFQFIVIDSKKSIFQYPHSLKQGKSQSFESYYYNPECKFDNNIDDICSEFLELVNSEVVKREKSN